MLPVQVKPAFAMFVRAAILLLLSISPGMAGSLDSIRCYVWDFAMRNGVKTELTRQLTVEFEEKLGNHLLEPGNRCFDRADHRQCRGVGSYSR